MELLKESTVYLNHKKDGGTVYIPQVFFNTHNLKENREIDLYVETLDDGRKALVCIPKYQPNSIQLQNQSN